MAFELTEGQQKALQMVRDLQKMEGTVIGRIRGVAGTGKTTMIRVLGSEMGDMAIVAPTGKAALRVTEATGLDATTIHRWLYTPRTDPLSGMVRFTHKEVEDIKIPSSGLVVVEESSMVGEKMWADIYNFAAMMNLKILCVGDPFQLPPVEEGNDSSFGILLNDFPADLTADLTEITRQALDSPIIRASMMVRKGLLEEGIMELEQVPERRLLEEHQKMLEHDGVVICHKNASRHELNTRIRAFLKKPDNSIADGEPLLVLKNNYVLNRFNGEVLKFNSWDKLPSRQWEVYDRYRQRTDRTSYGIADVEGNKVGLAMGGVLGRLDLSWAPALEEVSRTACGKEYPFLMTNYGYTLTAHKSQGSEWKQALVVVEPSVRWNGTEGRRWVYTAITRAKERCKVVWNVKIT